MKTNTKVKLIPLASTAAENLTALNATRAELRKDDLKGRLAGSATVAESTAIRARLRAQVYSEIERQVTPLRTIATGGGDTVATAAGDNLGVTEGGQ